MLRQNSDDFDEQNRLDDELRGLFAQATADIAPRRDLEARVRHRATRASWRPAAGAYPPLPDRLPVAAATLSAFLVVALLAGVFVWFGPSRVRRGVSGTPTATLGPAPTATPLSTIPAPALALTTLPALPNCATTAQGTPWHDVGGVPNPPDHSMTIDRSATSSGLTLHLLRGYADATQTVIAFEVLPKSKPQQNASPTMPDMVTLTLVDAHGTRYPARSESSGGDDLGRMDSSGNIVPLPPQPATALFPALPLDELGTPQALTLSVKGMQSVVFASPPGGGPVSESRRDVAGNWTVRFTLTPAAPRSYLLDAPAVTHQGLTVQPLRVDVVGPGGGLDFADGGLRLIVRFSGLDPRTVPFAFGGFAFQSPVGAGAGCGSGVFEVIPPGGGTPAVPASVEPADPADLAVGPDGNPTVQAVGPSGTLDVAVIYFNWPTVFDTVDLAGAPATLGIDHVGACTDPVNCTQTTVYNGPWSYRLRLP